MRLVLMVVVGVLTVWGCGSDDSRPDLPIVFDSSLDFGVSDSVVVVDYGHGEGVFSDSAYGPDAPDTPLLSDNSVLPDTHQTDSVTDPGSVDDLVADLGTDAGGEDTAVPCFIGQYECFGGSATPVDGKTCAGAITVGRWQAFDGGIVYNPSTYDSGDDDDLPSSAGDDCWDSGDDVFYRIYLKSGETLAVILGYHPDINMMAKIYRGSECGQAFLANCWDENVDGPKVGEVNTEAEIFQFVPDHDGWYTIVFDGVSLDDEGQHFVQFTLFNCQDVDCCC